MAVSDFPLTTWMLKDLALNCDFVSVRYDTERGSGTVLGECAHVLKFLGAKHRIFPGESSWDRWRWRQELWDSVAHLRPFVVLFPDHDERFDAAWWGSELDTFIRCPAVKAMFDYKMATADGRPVVRYPAAPHCKAFKWDPALGYRPYQGYAVPTYPEIGKFDSCYSAAAPMHHYCFWTREIEHNKQLHR